MPLQLQPQQQQRRQQLMVKEMLELL